MLRKIFSSLILSLILIVNFALFLDAQEPVREEVLKQEEQEKWWNNYEYYFDTNKSITADVKVVTKKAYIEGMVNYSKKVKYLGAAVCQKKCDPEKINHKGKCTDMKKPSGTTAGNISDETVCYSHRDTPYNASITLGESDKHLEEAAFELEAKQEIKLNVLKKILGITLGFSQKFRKMKQKVTEKSEVIVGSKQITPYHSAPCKERFTRSQLLSCVVGNYKVVRLELFHTVYKAGQRDVADNPYGSRYVKLGVPFRLWTPYDIVLSSDVVPGVDISIEPDPFSIGECICGESSSLVPKKPANYRPVDWNKDG